MKQEMVTINGSVDTVIFNNSDTGFTVFELVYEEELLSVVGVLGEVNVGEELELTGSFVSHPTYGHQFKAEVCTHTLPATASAIKKYLASGVIKGIGPATASRIVDKFGDDTLKIIEEEPTRLAEIRGISQKQCEKFSEEFKRVFGIRSLMVFMSKYGIPPAQSVKAWKMWGEASVEIIRGNPYILCSPVFQIRFETTDLMAKDCDLELNSHERVLAALRFVLMHNANNGHTCVPRHRMMPLATKMLNLPEEEVQEMLETMIERGELTSVKRKKEFILLPELYQAERYIASRIALMVSVPQDEPVNIDFVIDQIEEQNSLKYEALQRTAIREVMINDVFILTGGPGTGKTTTLNAIIDVLEYQGKTISIAAPTGRAAKRISEVTGREAKTIHRLLEVEMTENGPRFTRNEQEPLESDVIIIDEMSMVDTLLFDSLLRATKPNAKIVLVGDYNQLPSVGAGNVLHDLLNSEVIPTVRLEQVFRQAAESTIVTNAHQIVHGQMPDLTQKSGDFFFLGRGSGESVAQTVIDLVSERLPKSYGYSPNTDIQVLCPQRKGELGVMELNRLLQAKLNPEAPGKVQFKSSFYMFRVGDKVMQTRNNYDIEWTRDTEKGQGIFNGDIGVIQMIDRGSQTLAIDFEDRIAYYSFELANELELAYAVTVHKSQGNEFEAVVLPIYGGYEKLYYRNLLYTAITRAKKILILVGSENRVRFMVDNNIKGVRYTNLKHLITEQVFE